MWTRAAASWFPTTNSEAWRLQTASIKVWMLCQASYLYGIQVLQHSHLPAAESHHGAGNELTSSCVDFVGNQRTVHHLSLNSNLSSCLLYIILRHDYLSVLCEFLWILIVEKTKLSWAHQIRCCQLVCLSAVPLIHKVILFSPKRLFLSLILTILIDWRPAQGDLRLYQTVDNNKLYLNSTYQDKNYKVFHSKTR